MAQRIDPDDPVEIGRPDKRVGRIRKALGYSAAGLASAWRTEAAFRLEALAALVLIPLACFLPVPLLERALLIASVLMVMVVELLNSSIESAIDRISLERHELSKRAKDTGSAAVLLALLIALVFVPEDSRHEPVVGPANLLELRASRARHADAHGAAVFRVGSTGNPAVALHALEHAAGAGAIHHENLRELVLAKGPAAIVVEDHEDVELRLGNPETGEESAPRLLETPIRPHEREEGRLLEARKGAIQRDLAGEVRESGVEGVRLGQGRCSTSRMMPYNMHTYYHVSNGRSLVE